MLLQFRKKETCEKAGEFGVCPYVTAQQILAGKWTMLILHELEDGPKRFSDLRRRIDITQATLSTQLRKLENEGMIHREVFAEVPPRVEYSMTDIGEKFIPVLQSIEVWGNEYIGYLKTKNRT